MKKIINPILIILLVVFMVFFVLIPLAYMVLGRISNPFSFDLDTVINSNISNIQNTRSKKDDLNLTCSNPNTSFEALVRDAVLTRDGDESTIKSKQYYFEINLDDPIVDWQYTEGKLGNEIASFVYHDTIVNFLAQKSVSDCAQLIEKQFTNFHDQGKGVEYFSSRAYLDSGKPIGLYSAVFRTHGQRDIKSRSWYWYIIDEVFMTPQNTQAQITTIWYTTYIGRTEYWIAFRSLKENEDSLNERAVDILDSITFLKF